MLLAMASWALSLHDVAWGLLGHTSLYLVGIVEPDKSTTANCTAKTSPSWGSVSPTKATYKRHHLVGAWLTVSECAAVIITAGSVATGSQGGC